jgi:hypothetical protein
VHRDSARPYHLYMIPMQLALPGPGANQFGSQPVIKRLERNARRWQLVRSRWINEVSGSSVCPACFVTHVEAMSPPGMVQVKWYLICGLQAEF